MTLREGRRTPGSKHSTVVGTNKSRKDRDDRDQNVGSYTNPSRIKGPLTSNGSFSREGTEPREELRVGRQGPRVMRGLVLGWCQ